MRVYVLSASADSGKTTTLNTLAYYLYSLAPRYVLGNGCNLPPPPHSNIDNQYWFDTVQAGKKVRVGIFTSGDTAGIIDNAFSYFASNNCDVCFMASRTYGYTVDEIEKKAHAIGVTPHYMHLISSVCCRTQSAIQHDVAVFLESLV